MTRLQASRSAVRDVGMDRRWFELRLRLGTWYADERDAFDDVFAEYDTGWERFHSADALARVRQLADKMLSEHGQSWNSISGRRILNALGAR